AAHALISSVDNVLIHKRTRPIMDEHIAVPRLLKPVPDRVIAFRTARDDLLYLCDPVRFYNMLPAVFSLSTSRDKDNLIDQFTVLECFQRIIQYRSASHEQILLMNFCPHSLSASCRKHYGGAILLIHLS